MPTDLPIEPEGETTQDVFARVDRSLNLSADEPHSGCAVCGGPLDRREIEWTDPRDRPHGDDPKPLAFFTRTVPKRITVVCKAGHRFDVEFHEYSTERGHRWRGFVDA
jgi:hypothetical protein